MKSPLSCGPLLELQETTSTQALAAALLSSGDLEVPGIIFAHNQLSGKGRFQRSWHSTAGESLTVSLIFECYANHPKPWLVSMATSLAVASAVHSQIQWPNDLVVNGKKIGGVLTELFPDKSGRLIPVVGIGLNLFQTSFPEDIKSRATSLTIEGRKPLSPIATLNSILDKLVTVPEPDSWQALQPVWQIFDATPGKKYRTVNGAEAIALGVGPEGELLCSINGESEKVLAADAIFG